jgi:hypothetical protein
MNVVIDNDIVFKGVCYGILRDILQINEGTKGDVGVLGAARFVVAKKIQRTKLNRTTELVMLELATFLSAATTLEPTDDEQALAADLESAAQRLGINLDVGESQLCAVAIERLVPLLLTGDKRAITAMEYLLDTEVRLQDLCGKIRCLEQAVACVLHQKELETLRTAICAEAAVDKALTICFGCSNANIQRETVLEGLDSYVRALRSAAPHILGS